MKTKKEKKSTTDCPACKIDTAECSCGLSRLVIGNQSGLMAKEAAIISFEHEEGYFHAVVKYDHMVIEQHIGNSLIGSVGPYFGDIGTNIFGQLVVGYEEKSCSIVGRRYHQNGGSKE